MIREGCHPGCCGGCCWGVSLWRCLIADVGGSVAESALGRIVVVRYVDVGGRVSMLVYFLAVGQLNHGAEHPSQNRSMQPATFLVYLLDSVLKQGYSGVSAEFTCTALCPRDLGNSRRL